MKQIIKKLVTSLFFLGSLAHAAPGFLFSITQSGNPADISIVLCLNGKGPVSCQNYQVSAENLSITTTINRDYPAAGIKILTPGYTATGCTPFPNGYCLFSVSNSQGTMIQLNPTTKDYTVTPSGDGHETISPSTPQIVSSGSTQAFTVTADPGYTLSTVTGGTCPTGSWNGAVYTTGAITNDCTVTFSAAIPVHIVTPGGDGHETISPSTPQIVSSGSTQAFTVTADPGYTLSTVTGGTCPTGSWNGAVYTTGAITNDCSVTFSAAVSVHTVTPGGDGHETISPSTPQIVSSGSTQAFTVTAAPGYILSTVTGGTCPTGSWNGSVYTTGVITNDCSVTFTAALSVYTVTPGGDGHETISPSTPQIVSSGNTLAFTVTADPGYVLSTVTGGTCPTGSWNGAIYTTGIITSNCSVTFSAALAVYTVTPGGDGNETISPSTPQSVTSGNTQAFTVTANSGYVLSTAVGGTCLAGSWNGTIYTTGAITSDCSVTFSASPILSVTGSPLFLLPNITGSLTVTNNGSQAITNVMATLPPGLAANVQQDSSQCAVLSAASSCYLHFTSNQELYPATSITISGSGTNSVPATITLDLPYVANGIVYAILLDTPNNRIYLGGFFSVIGSNTGRGVPIDATTGLAQAVYPRVNNTIDAVVSDNNGGWFIGGEFTSVGDVPIAYIAHILADGSVDPSWIPPTLNNRVYALALDATAGRLYVGGNFFVSGPNGGNNFVVLNSLTGAAIPWSDRPNGSVRSLALSGNKLYAGGLFSLVGNQARTNLAVLDTTTGTVDSWNPVANGQVRTIAVSGNTVYAGGAFTSVGGQTRNRIAAVDATSGAATNWNPNADNIVYSIAVSGNTLYAGGSFTTIGGQTRNRIAALDTTVDTNNATNWNPDAGANSYVTALTISGSTVYVAGSFENIGNQPRNSLAALDTTQDTNNATSWDPIVGGFINSLAYDGINVYVGGGFGTVNGLRRTNLASIDASTGVATSWNPVLNGTVNALAGNNNTIYVGGVFTTIDGVTRNRLAAFNSGTGVLTSWNPNVSAPVVALVVDGNRLYAGGNFSSVSSTPRRALAAFDLSTGALTSWNPNPNAQVTTIVPSGSIVYVGGTFTTFNFTTTRNRLAALDSASGLPTSWAPDANNIVRTMALSGNTLYVGGDFTTINGITRNRIAAINTSTGTPTAWDPNASGIVSALALKNNIVYAGGGFSNIGGQPRVFLASLDASINTNNATSWNPVAAQGAVYSLVLSDSSVYLGGAFSSVYAIPGGRFAIVPISLS